MKYKVNDRIELTKEITVIVNPFSYMRIFKGLAVILEVNNEYYTIKRDTHIVKIHYKELEESSVLVEEEKPVTMYSNVVATGLTYGQAMDALIHRGKKVTREVWRGYWELREFRSTEGNTKVIMAVLRDNKGIEPASPYNEDKFACDWMIVE